jgi:beta-lactam-binding protein with PASTA domain
MRLDLLPHLHLRQLGRAEGQAGLGSFFAGWSGACTGKKAACTVSMTAARSVRASFRLKACVVPRVKGRTLRVAERQIKAHGCRVGKVRHAFSARVKRRRVISQSPKPHSRHKHGARVNLVVSKGKTR